MISSRSHTTVPADVPKPNAPSTTAQYRFGLFEVDVANEKLFRQGRQVKLQGQPFQLLGALLERSGDTVRRDELRQRLWPGDTFVEFDKSLGVAVTKLRDALGDDADNPRFIETVPRCGYRFIAPVERQNTVSAPHSASTPEGGKLLPVPVPAAPPKRRWPPKATLALAVCLIALIAASIYAFRLAPRRSSSTVTAGTAATAGVERPVRMRRSVAVLGFRNLPGRPEDNWLSTAFSEMLNTELAAGDNLRIVSGEDVARAKRELPLTEQDTLSKPTLERLRKNPGADMVVLGAYTLIRGKGENRIRLDIRLQDTASGETIAEEAVAGNEADLFELATHTGADLRRSLGVSLPSADAAITARASLPSNQQAVRLYAEGRAKLWVFDFASARDLLVNAVAADPSYPLAHSALSDAWWHLGYQFKARAEGHRALELSQNLPEEERLLVEGQYRVTSGDQVKAVEAYQSLFRLFPDSLEYGLLLATAQYHVKPSDSVVTLATLRHLPPPESDDARIDLVEASAWLDQDFAKSQAAAKRAVDKGSALGSQLLVARAYGILCQQAGSTGTSTAEGIGQCERARQSYAAAGDRNNEARTLSDFAVVYFQRGDLAHAEAMWHESAKEFRKIGDTEGVAATLNNLGDARFLRGDLDEARNLMKESIPNYEDVEDQDGVARALNDLGGVSRQSGDLEAAMTAYQQAKAIAEKIDDKSTIAYVLSGLGDVQMDRGDLAAARRSYEESLALRNQTGEKQAAMETQVALAALSIEEGHAADAEVALQKCEEQFHQEQQADDELKASVLLTQAFLAENRRRDARKEIERAELLATKSQNRFARLQYGLASAHVLYMSDRPELSRPQLEQLLKEARERGFVGVELEARLALAESENKSGHIAAAQEQLVSLEKIASAKGFGLIARKAAARRGRSDRRQTVS